MRGWAISLLLLVPYLWLVLGQGRTQADLVITFAGTNTPNLIGLAIDSNTDNLFVSDYANTRILRYDAVATLTASSTPSATFTSAGQIPYGIFVDNSSTLWSSDLSTNSVVFWNGASTGGGSSTISGSFGGGGAVSSQTMYSPQGQFVDSLGNLWVADAGNNRVLRFDNVKSKTSGAPADGVLGQAFFNQSQSGISAEQMANPEAVFVDSSGNVWVSDLKNNRLLYFTAGQAQTNGGTASLVLMQLNFTSNSFVNPPTAGSGHLPGVITFGAYGELYVADSANNRVLVYLPPFCSGMAASFVLGQSSFNSSIQGSPGNGPYMNQPTAVAYHFPTQSLWVADQLSQRLLRFSNLTFASPPLPDTPANRCLVQLRDIAVTPLACSFVPDASVTFAQYNTILAQYVVIPKSTADIQRALACAAENGVTVAVKNGGHNYAGFSQAPADGFQIWVQPNLNNYTVVNFDGKVALRVSAGAVGGQIYQWLSTNMPGWLLAGGLCPSVGTVAFHVGGGLGALSRMFGMGADNMLEATMVTSDGSSIVTANAATNPNLYWALRGGGGPSFGVVTELVIQLHQEAEDPKYTFGEYCVGNASEDIIASLQLLAEITAVTDFPDWLTVDWRLVNRDPLLGNNGTGLCYLVYSLKSRNETLFALEPLFGQPALERSAPPPGQKWNFLQEESSFLAMIKANAKTKGYLTQTLRLKYPSYNKNCILPPLNSDLIQALVAQYYTMPSYSCYIQGLALGGGPTTAVPVSDTAFPWRGAGLYAADAECDSSGAGNDTAELNFVSSYIERVSPWCQGAFLNFPYLDLENFAESYWSTNLPRLQSVRAIWNPNENNPLAFAQAVPLPYVSEATRRSSFLLSFLNAISTWTKYDW